MEIAVVLGLILSQISINIDRYVSVVQIGHEMYNRRLGAALEEAAKNFPVISITGPRQSGKTWLARNQFKDKPYFCFEDPMVRDRFVQNPQKFLEATLKSGAIFDEIQNVPEICSFLQPIVDQSSETGRFVLTSSQNLAISATVSQSLAGRVGVFALLPLSAAELNEGISNKLEMEKLVWLGGFPRLHNLNVDPERFFPSYVQTYLERDLRDFKQIGDLATFRKFLKLCAGRIGQPINFSSLAQDAGIAPNTARAWLSILEASYIIFTVVPYHKNFNKRLIKQPKMYFCDTGLAAFLLDIRSSEQLELHWARGPLFENLVILEIYKHLLARGDWPILSFWKNQSGNEVDLLIEKAGQTIAIEIKSEGRASADSVKNLNYFRKYDPTAKTILVYNGPAAWFGENELLSLADLDKFFKQVLK